MRDLRYEREIMAYCTPATSLCEPPSIQWQRVFTQIKRIIITKATSGEAFHRSKLHHTIQPQRPGKEEHSSTFKEADAFLHGF